MTPEVCAIIPARGGSQGIPRKNIALLGGRPLMSYTIEAALRCPLIGRLIVSTDDAEIAGVAREWGAEVPFLRPADLANDRAVVGDVALYTLKRLYREEGYHPAYHALLYPTSPFRTRNVLCRLVESVLDESFQSAQTVRSDWISKTTFVEEAGGRVLPLRSNVSDTYVYTPAGSSQVFTTPSEHVMMGLAGVRTGLHQLKRLGIPEYYTPPAYIELEHPAEEIDIDYPEDLELAEEIVRKGLFHD